MLHNPKQMPWGGRSSPKQSELTTPVPRGAPWGSKRHWSPAPQAPPAVREGVSRHPSPSWACTHSPCLSLTCSGGRQGPSPSRVQAEFWATGWGEAGAEWALSQGLLSLDWFWSWSREGLGQDGGCQERVTEQWAPPNQVGIGGGHPGASAGRLSSAGPALCLLSSVPGSTSED